MLLLYHFSTNTCVRSFLTSFKQLNERVTQLEFASTAFIVVPYFLLSNNWTSQCPLLPTQLASPVPNYIGDKGTLYEQLAQRHY